MIIGNLFLFFLIFYGVLGHAQASYFVSNYRGWRDMEPLAKHGYVMDVFDRGSMVSGLKDDEVEKAGIVFVLQNLN